MRLACVLTALLVVLPSSVNAQPSDDADRTDLARRHFQSGGAYFEEVRFDEAAREFRESYRLSPRVDLLYNIAQCYLRKGDAARAVEFYKRYLEVNASAKDRVSIEHTIAGLKRQIGAVRIAGAPDG